MSGIGRRIWGMLAMLACLTGMTAAQAETAGEPVVMRIYAPETAIGEQTAQRLAGAGICVRAGLHCAPLAHESAGTLETGTVRLSISAFNTAREILQAAAILKK